MASIWFVYAMFAAILWGIGYALDEKIMEAGIKPMTLFFLHIVIILPIFSVIAFKYVDFQQEFKLAFDNKFLLSMIIISSLTVMGGNLFILMSVAEKNASLTSIIEISFPVFVIFFSWLFFRNVHIDLWTAAGGILIFSGAALIYLKA